MQPKQKFFYMVTGAVLGVTILLIGMAVSPTTAQRDTLFGHIICTQLSVVGQDGKERVWLGTTGKGDGSVGVLGKDLKRGVLLRTDEHGGEVTVTNNDGKPAAEMNVTEHGGRIAAANNEGKVAVEMTANKNDGLIASYNRDGKVGAIMGSREHGGVIGIRNKDGEYIARMFSNDGIGTIQVADLRVTDKVPYGTEWVRLWGADNGGHVAVYGKNADLAAAYMTARLEGGGIIWVTDQDGNAVATLTSYERGGLVRVRGKDGADRADMKAGKFGGLVNVYGNDGERRSAMGVNQYGNGAVTTWDKRGEKRGNLK